MVICAEDGNGFEAGVVWVGLPVGGFVSGMVGCLFDWAGKDGFWDVFGWTVLAKFWRFSAAVYFLDRSVRSVLDFWFGSFCYLFPANPEFGGWSTVFVFRGTNERCSKLLHQSKLCDILSIQKVIDIL